MNSLAAFAMGEMNRHREQMVFDWDMAAEIIRNTGATFAAAGLRGDWEYTGGAIYEDGKPLKKCDTFLASTWATPELYVNGEYIDCYRMKSETPGWDYDTKWPASALAILEG
jgi:hypothetical protein